MNTSRSTRLGAVARMATAVAAGALLTHGVITDSARAVGLGAIALVVALALAAHAIVKDER